MDKKMQLYQHEQTGGEAEPAALQDALTGALIGLVRAADANPALTEETNRVVIEGLYATMPHSGFTDEAIQRQIEKVRLEKERLVPECSNCAAPCGRNDDYDMELLWKAGEAVRSAKAHILYEIRTMASYAYHAMLLGYSNVEICDFFREALFRLGYEETVDGLLPTAMKANEIRSRCIALLDRANTEACVDSLKEGGRQ